MYCKFQIMLRLSKAEMTRLISPSLPRFIRDYCCVRRVCIHIKHTYTLCATIYKRISKRVKAEMGQLWTILPICRSATAAFK